MPKLGTKSGPLVETIPGQTISIQELIEDQEAQVAVIGLGYVGLPLVVKLAELGFDVLGVDYKSDVIEALKQADGSIYGIPSDRIRQVVINTVKLEPITVAEKAEEVDHRTVAKLAKADVFIVCVHTPLHSERAWQPDISYIEEASKLIDRVLLYKRDSRQTLSDCLIVLESTTYPGTTKEVFGPVVDRYKRAGGKCCLAYSPERMNPGPAIGSDGKVLSEPEQQFKNTVRIVGGIDDSSRRAAGALYGQLCDSVHYVENLESAEMVKLLENGYRYNAIAWANEMAMIARSWGLDIYLLLDAVKTKKEGLDICNPGLPGGHCIPIDPHYLGHKARERGIPSKFIECAEKVIREMETMAYELIQRVHEKHDRSLMGSKVLVLGVTYKPEVADVRGSKVKPLIRKLFTAGADVFYWDPVWGIRSHQLTIDFSKSEADRLSRTRRKLLQIENGRYQLTVQPAGQNDWESVRDELEQGDYKCVIVNTSHRAFHDAYDDILNCDNLLIVDLCDGIGSRNKKKKITASESEDYMKEREELCKRPNYVLLGVH